MGTYEHIPCKRYYVQAIEDYTLEVCSQKNNEIELWLIDCVLLILPKNASIHLIFGFIFPDSRSCDSFTCPYCGQLGLPAAELRDHAQQCCENSASYPSEVRK